MFVICTAVVPSENFNYISYTDTVTTFACHTHYPGEPVPER